MGSGLSSYAEKKSNIDDLIDGIFIDETLVDGAKLFKIDKSARISFADFIKNGSWIYKLSAQDYLLTTRLTHEERLAIERLSVLCQYILPKKDNTVAASIHSSITVLTNKSIEKENDHYSNSYADIEKETCISLPQMVGIMFSIVYPLYLTSSDYKQWKENGQTDMASVAMSEKSTENEGNKSTYKKRAQELLLGAAALHDEDKLLDILENGNWLVDLKRCIYSLPSGLMIFEVKNKDTFDCPIVYVNEQFTKISGYDTKTSINKNYDFLNGINTEEEQIQLINNAINQGKPIKVGLTNYKKNGNSFVNMLSLMPIYDKNNNLTHFLGFQLDITDKKATIQSLSQIDDMLALIPYLLKH